MHDPPSTTFLDRVALQTAYFQDHYGSAIVYLDIKVPFPLHR